MKIKSITTSICNDNNARAEQSALVHYKERDLIMWGNLSEYPRLIWDGLKNLSPMSRYRREVGEEPAPTGQDFSAVCDEVIKIEEQTLGLHSYVVRLDNELTATKDDLETKIETVKEEIATVSKMPGPPGQDGKDGESIIGPPGQDGKDGESIIGPPGQDGKTPVVKLVGDQLEIDGVIQPLHLKGKDGKSVTAKRPIGSGWSGGGSTQGLQGFQGPPGKDGTGGGVIPHTAEIDSNCSVGQPLFIRANTHADLAKADAGSTIAVGLSNSITLANHAVEYLTDSAITQDDWSGVIEDGSPSLTIGIYFLSGNVAGKITQVPPTVGIIQRVGRALSPTCLDIEISEGILL
jgi:hypothetical protein